MRPRKAISALVVVVALAASLAAAPAQARVKGFSLGVAVGEVNARSAKIWAHADGTGRVSAKVAVDRRMRRVVAGAKLTAKRSNDGTMQKTIRGLKPGMTYWYRFCRGVRTCSAKGRFETAPRSASSSRIHFAVTGDADPTPLPGESTPFYGTYEAFRAMRRERNDFNVFMGDTIYSDTGVDGPPALTAKQKWAKYAQGLGLRNQRKLRASGSVYSHWDDHEFINDFSIPEDGERLYKAGVRAFTDYAPVGYSSRDGLYRTFRWGKNVEVFFLDERSFRSAKASAGGTCDNPDTGSPDLAATAPVAKRNLFALLIPSLAQPVSQACKNAINDPKRTLLGARQLRRFLDDVESSDARWKVIMNETPVQQFYGLPYDRWEGYAYERVMLLQELQKRGVSDLVFFTTDTHAAFANVVRERTYSDDIAPANAGPTASETPYNDYIIGPVATEPFWPEIDAVTGGDGDGELLSEVFFKPDPPVGVGMMCSQGDQNSYAQISAGKKKLKIDYKSETGDPVIDVDGSTCGPYVLKR
jgi:phosphodiesterase/alkaline phosphatase D-like protein